MGLGPGAGDVAPLGSAHPVTQDEGSALGGREEALATPEVEDFGSPAEHSGDDVGVAGEAAYF